MKELYTSPVSEVKEFATTDVVTTSIEVGDGGLD